MANVSPEWGSVYSQIFGLSNQTIFDTLIQTAVSQSDWQDAVWVATLAELNGYSSQTINDCLVTTLENMPMCGSLPVTCYDANQSVMAYPAEAFCVYDRYMVNAYRYAQELGVSGWNITQAFSDFANAVIQAPENLMWTGSHYGELLWVNPEENFSASYSSRYFDEFAETLDMFLEFALNGVTGNITVNGLSLNATSFMDYLWNSAHVLWNGNYYNYNLEGPCIECEMGNFAQVISEYQNYRGTLPYFNRVIGDLEYTLLSSGWNSPIWATTGVVEHATASPEQEERLPETLGEMIALQMLYPDFSSSMKNNFQNMLSIGWQGLINSELYANQSFTFFADYTNGSFIPESFTSDASLLGAMTLFLDGIIPQTGSLAITPSNERYEDYQTCFPVSQWQFNYADQTITIPVDAGTLGFIFGSREVTQNFPTNGVYQVQFSSDWNSITSAKKIAGINNVTLNPNPVTLQTQIRPGPRPAPTPTPTATPTASPTFTSSPTNTPLKIENTTPVLEIYGLAATLCLAGSISVIAVFLKRKNLKGKL